MITTAFIYIYLFNHPYIATEVFANVLLAKVDSLNIGPAAAGPADRLRRPCIHCKIDACKTTFPTERSSYGDQWRHSGGEKGAKGGKRGQKGAKGGKRGNGGQPLQNFGAWSQSSSRRSFTL